MALMILVMVVIAIGMVSALSNFSIPSRRGMEEGTQLQEGTQPLSSPFPVKYAKAAKQLQEGMQSPKSLRGTKLLLFNIKALITFGNLMLLLCLLFIYAKNYGQIKSQFAMGLIAFIVLLIMQALTSNPFVPAMWGIRRMPILGLFAIVPDVFEFVALSVLLYISLKS